VPIQGYLLDTQWHVRILVSVFGKFQIETDFAPLAFVCAGGRVKRVHVSGQKGGVCVAYF